MIVYRICQTYPPDHDPIDGKGAFKNGGRWNSKGTYAIYTAASLALARSELARHVNLESVPESFRVYEIEIPDEGFEAVNPLPDDWDDDPPPLSTQLLGDEFLRDPGVLGIKVLSVCDPSSFNYILNLTSTLSSFVKVVRDFPFIA